MRWGTWALAWCLLLAGCTQSPAPSDTPASVVSGSPTSEPSGRVGPKNVILMVGDGMGFHHLDVASLFSYGTSRFQISGKWPSIRAIGGPKSQVVDHFDTQVAVDTHYSEGRYEPEQIWKSVMGFQPNATDSAAAATALATGHKTVRQALGVDASGRVVGNVVEAASSAAKSTGVVSSVPFSHATPAGFIVHANSRNDLDGIVSQVLASDIDVVLSPGHPWFGDAAQRLSMPKYDYITESAFVALERGETPFRFIQEKADFVTTAVTVLPVQDAAPQLFGLVPTRFALQSARSDRLKESPPFTIPDLPVPSLADLSLAALRTLAADRDGFFLMIEGGAIDLAAHEWNLSATVEETIRFLAAVQRVSDWVNENSSWDETLLVVTVDHETGFLVGPGTSDKRGWQPMTGQVGQLPKVDWLTDYHSNQLVPLFAKGIWADRLGVLAAREDPVRGRYLDNAEVGRFLLSCFAD